MDFAKFYPKIDDLSEWIVRAEKGPDEIRWLYIDAVLTLFQGNISATARRLKMHRRTLQRIIASHAEEKK